MKSKLIEIINTKRTIGKRVTDAVSSSAIKKASDRIMPEIERALESISNSSDISKNAPDTTFKTDKTAPGS